MSESPALKRIRDIREQQRKLDGDLVAAITLARAGGRGHSWRAIGERDGAFSHQGARKFYWRKVERRTDGSM